VEHHERIFEVFQSMGRKDGRRGSGIGLAIVKKIVETHGGRVWVESARGEGSTFHVHLPRR
jgi:signal transduction histidine kinase